MIIIIIIIIIIIMIGKKQVKSAYGPQSAHQAGS